MQDINSLNIGLPMNSESVDVLQVRSTFIGDDELIATIDQIIGQTATTVTYSLLPVGGNPVDFYRENEVLFATIRQTQAQIVAQSAGQITLRALDTTLAAVIASFSTGATTYSLGIHVPYRQSSGVAGLNHVPDVQVNYMSTLRDGNGWDRVDMQKSRVDPKIAGTKYWKSSDISRTLSSMLGHIEKNWMWSTPYYDPATNMSRMGGVDWAIRTRGGKIHQFGAPPTQSDFQDWIDALYYTNLGTLGSTRKLCMGNKLYQYINNNFSANFIVEIQNQAPKSGAIDQNNRLYKVGGREVVLDTSLAVFSDPLYNAAPTTIVGLDGTKMEWSCYYLDLNPVDTYQNGTVPAIRKIHFGKSPFYAAMGKGIGDSPMGMPSEIGIALNPESLSSDLLTMQDTSTVQFMYHGGVDMATGYYSGIFEPTN